ncbi:MAG: sensor histidine kinase [Clostridiales bacterium]|nr:sensor histidine kinase [Clostridiales bacterium]
MWMSKKQHLKASYYYSFFALIVIPILLITLISILVIRTMMFDSATRNIRQAQDTIASTLENEVKDISLRLSHFIYVNNNEIMKIAAKTDTRDVVEKHHYTEVLTEAFNYAMVPVQDILSTVFYMKDGAHVYMKDDIVLPDTELKTSSWYQSAIADKNTVKIGFYNTNVTTSRRTAHTLTLVAALSPGIDVDRDGAIEMAALFADAQTGHLIREYNTDELLGTTLLLDAEGTVVFDEGGASHLLPGTEKFSGQDQFYHRANGRKYVYVVSEEPVSGLKIVSIVASDTLTRDYNRVAALIILVIVFLFGLFYVFSSYFLRNIIDPIHTTVQGMQDVENGNLQVHIDPRGQAELRTMIHSFNRMTRRLKELMEETRDLERKKSETEIRALQSQINPHFLVNSLSSIRFIAQASRFDSIARMAEALMKILSCSFRGNKGFYTLKEELEVLDGFIYLMKIRYSDSFEIHYEVEDACLDCLVPRLILQPVVENSIVHGFSDLMDELGEIRLNIREEEGFLIICVRDNGKGMSAEEIRRLLSGSETDDSEHQSIGIRNVNARLVLNYGADCRLTMESQKGSYTNTRIRFPAGREHTERQP